MDFLLNGLVTVAQAGAMGVIGYGLYLCLRADAWLIQALRTSRGEGVQASRPAHLSVRPA